MFVDHFTKYAEAAPYKSADAPETAKLIFGTWIARHGVPMAIQSDNGPAFAAELQREFVAIAGSLKIYSSPVHPSTNGLVERQNRSLISILRATCTRNQGEWIDHLPHALGAYNCMKHASTGFTPNMLMLNKERRYSLALLFPEQHPKAKNFYVRDLIRRAARIHQIARQNLKQAQVRQKLNYDKFTKNQQAYKVGQKVAMHVKTIPRGGVGKLNRAYRGPFVIHKVNQGGRWYTLDNGYAAHFERLKPWNDKLVDLATGDSLDDWQPPDLPWEASDYEEVIPECEESGRRALRFRG